MDVLYAILLGIVEGLSEFLPVSSTGHLILAERVLGIDGDASPWRILLWVSQFAAILAVIVYFWRDLWRRIFRPRSRDWRKHLLTKLVVAMIPTVALALPFKKYFDPLETKPVPVAAALIVGALVMEFIDRRYRRDFPQELEDVTLRQAALIGALQCISMWPGVSRSGATIMAGMALGLTPRVATEFSFYLAIPTMLGAAAKTLLKYHSDLTGSVAALLLVGSATAFIVALLVVMAFLSYVRRYRFTPFVIYRIVLGAAVLAYYFFAA
jgi:undecaprenyl-diphosphatase